MNTGNMSNDEANVICNFIEQLNNLTMKTAMQEMVDWLKSQEAICIKNGNQYQADFINGHILVALPLLEKEKQQIEDAYEDGHRAAIYFRGTMNYFKEKKYNENETNI